MIITESGILIRMPVETISKTGRNTQGVKLIRLGEEETVATVAVVENTEDEEAENQTETVETVTEAAPTEAATADDETSSEN
jgi:DNA gyrase subunit A